MRPALLLLALLGACQNEAPPRTPGGITPQGDVVLTINGTIEVHQNMYDAVMDRIPPEQLARMESSPGGLSRLEEQLAMSQILYQKALEAGLPDDPQIRTGMAMAERDYLAAVYVQRQGEQAVTDEAIATRYEERQVQYARPQVKARHILVTEESKANELKEKLDAGADFAELARAHSKDPGSKDKGGDLGWFEQRRMDPAFGEAAFAATPGEVVGPVKSRFGYHLIEVLERRESVPLDEVRDEIASSLRQEAIQELLQGLQAELEITRPGQPEPTAEAPKGAKTLKPVGVRPAPIPAANDPRTKAAIKALEDRKKAEAADAAKQP